jgi:hypothetical protein
VRPCPTQGRQVSNGIGPRNIAQAIASGHLSPSVRELLAGLTKTKRDQLITNARRRHWAAYPAKGTLIQEIVYVQTAEVPAPGDR